MGKMQMNRIMATKVVTSEPNFQSESNHIDPDLSWISFIRIKNLVRIAQIAQTGLWLNS